MIFNTAQVAFGFIQEEKEEVMEIGKKEYLWGYGPIVEGD